MPEGVTKQTAKIFVMTMPDSEGVYRQVIVQGDKLAYDANGMITSGLITRITYNVVQDDGKTVEITQQNKWAGLNVDAGMLVEAFGTTSWNHIKVVTERFGVLDSLHGGVLRSDFTTTTGTIDGTDKAERLQGGFRNDMMDGRDGDDRLSGRAGNDSLDGGEGNDRLLGGLGDDVLTDTAGKTNAFSAGLGDDRLYGGTGNDQMSGDGGNDVLFGHGGQDIASGGRGADSFVFDIKEEGTLRIYDFAIAEDVLVNMTTATAKDAYSNFIDHAMQVGRNVEYHDGGQTVVLLRARLDQLTVDNFAGSEAPPDVLM